MLRTRQISGTLTPEPGNTGVGKQGYFGKTRSMPFIPSRLIKGGFFMSLFATLTEDGSYALTGAGYTAIIVIMLILLAVACYFTSSSNVVKNGTRKLVFAAMAMALAYVTSMIKVLHMPMGGSITLFSMLFITLIGYWYGLRTGLTAAFAYGLLQLVIDPYILSVPQLLCDYVLAFGALGLSGVFHNAKNGLIKGYFLGVLGRFVFSFLSGYIFFGDYAPEGMNPAVYSFLYNGAYIFAEAALTIVLLAIPAVAHGLLKVKNMAVQNA